MFSQKIKELLKDHVEIEQAIVERGSPANWLKAVSNRYGRDSNQDALARKIALTLAQELPAKKRLPAGPKGLLNKAFVFLFPLSAELQIDDSISLKSFECGYFRCFGLSTMKIIELPVSTTIAPIISLQDIPRAKKDLQAICKQESSTMYDSALQLSAQEFIKVLDGKQSLKSLSYRSSRTGYTADPYSLINLMAAQMAWMKVELNSSNPLKDFWLNLYPEVTGVIDGQDNTFWPRYGEALFEDNKLINYRNLYETAKKHGVQQVVGQYSESTKNRIFSFQPMHANFWALPESSELKFDNYLDFFETLLSLLYKYRANNPDRGSHFESDIGDAPTMEMQAYLDRLIAFSTYVTSLPEHHPLKIKSTGLIDLKTKLTTWVGTNSCFNNNSDVLRDALKDQTLRYELKELAFSHEEIKQYLKGQIYSGQDRLPYLHAHCSARIDSMTVEQLIEAANHAVTRGYPIPSLVKRFKAILKKQGPHYVKQDRDEGGRLKDKIKRGVTERVFNFIQQMNNMALYEKNSFLQEFYRDGRWFQFSSNSDLIDEIKFFVKAFDECMLREEISTYVNAAVKVMAESERMSDLNSIYLWLSLLSDPDEASHVKSYLDLIGHSKIAPLKYECHDSELKWLELAVKHNHQSALVFYVRAFHNKRDTPLHKMSNDNKSKFSRFILDKYFDEISLSTDKTQEELKLLADNLAFKIFDRKDKIEFLIKAHKKSSLVWEHKFKEIYNDSMLDQPDELALCEELLERYIDLNNIETVPSAPLLSVINASYTKGKNADPVKLNTLVYQLLNKFFPRKYPNGVAIGLESHFINFILRHARIDYLNTVDMIFDRFESKQDDKMLVMLQFYPSLRWIELAIQHCRFKALAFMFSRLIWAEASEFQNQVKPLWIKFILEHALDDIIQFNSDFGQVKIPQALATEHHPRYVQRILELNQWPFFTDFRVELFRYHRDFDNTVAYHPVLANLLKIDTMVIKMTGQLESFWGSELRAIQCISYPKLLVSLHTALMLNNNPSYTYNEILLHLTIFKHMESLKVVVSDQDRKYLAHQCFLKRDETSFDEILRNMGDAEVKLFVDELAACDNEVTLRKFQDISRSLNVTGFSCLLGKFFPKILLSLSNDYELRSLLDLVDQKFHSKVIPEQLFSDLGLTLDQAIVNKPNLKIWVLNVLHNRQSCVWGSTTKLVLLDHLYRSSESYYLSPVCREELFDYSHSNDVSKCSSRLIERSFEYYNYFIRDQRFILNRELPLLQYPSHSPDSLPTYKSRADFWRAMLERLPLLKQVWRIAIISDPVERYKRLYKLSFERNGLAVSQATGSLVFFSNSLDLTKLSIPNEWTEPNSRAAKIYQLAKK